jgi:hypothetical protein
VNRELHDSLFELYIAGGLELATATVRDFHCRHDDDDDQAGCAICRWQSGGDAERES